MELSPREQLILRSVIHSFILNAKPVGSRTVGKRNNLNLSPATIRNTMSDLEALGLLEQPHTSAGRVPTDLGYRVYVDSLMDQRRLTPRMKELIDEGLSESHTNLEEILHRSSALLGKLSSLLGVVLSPKFEESILQKIDLTKLSTERLLVILAVKSGMAKTIILELNFSLHDSEMENTCRLLNRRLQGLSLRQIRDEITDRIREVPPDTPKDLITLFVDNADQVFRFEESGVFYHTGLKKLMMQPEFARAEKFRSVIELIEDKNVLVHLLTGVKPEDGVRITIGGENPVKKSRELSVISAAFKLGDNLGTVNIMGPTRMDYSKALSLVDYTAKTLEKCIK